jgi:steroid 5-alpha reductase family enzyme
VRQQLVFIASFLYAIRLNGNYFQANGWSFIGLEDWRYVIIRKQLEAKGINWSVPGFVLVYISQWLMVWLATIGIYDIMTASHNLDFSDMFGFLMIVCGVLLEFVADQQLVNFISFSKSAKNPIMKTGLWSVSRHPNYIGQMLIWVSLKFLALFFLFSFSLLLDWICVLDFCVWRRQIGLFGPAEYRRIALVLLHRCNGAAHAELQSSCCSVSSVSENHSPNFVLLNEKKNV